MPPRPSPVGALRCGALQRQGLPSSSGLEPLRAAEAACLVLWAHCSDPRRGEQHTILLLQTRPALRDQYLPCMAGLHTLSGEHTWMQHAPCPQFPELMSQFSFSISTRFLKASFCYNLLSQLGVATGEGGEFLCQENICFAGQRDLSDDLRLLRLLFSSPLPSWNHLGVY